MQVSAESVVGKWATYALACLCRWRINFEIRKGKRAQKYTYFLMSSSFGGLFRCIHLNICLNTTWVKKNKGVTINQIDYVIVSRYCCLWINVLPIWWGIIPLISLELNCQFTQNIKYNFIKFIKNIEWRNILKWFSWYKTSLCRPTVFFTIGKLNL